MSSLSVVRLIYNWTVLQTVSTIRSSLRHWLMWDISTSTMIIVKVSMSMVRLAVMILVIVMLVILLLGTIAVIARIGDVCAADDGANTNYYDPDTVDALEVVARSIVPRCLASGFVACRASALRLANRVDRLDLLLTVASSVNCCDGISVYKAGDGECDEGQGCPHKSGTSRIPANDSVEPFPFLCADRMVVIVVKVTVIVLIMVKWLIDRAGVIVLEVVLLALIMMIVITLAIVISCSC